MSQAARQKAGAVALEAGYSVTVLGKVERATRKAAGVGASVGGVHQEDLRGGPKHRAMGRAPQSAVSRVLVRRLSVDKGAHSSYLAHPRRDRTCVAFYHQFTCIPVLGQPYFRCAGV